MIDPSSPVARALTTLLSGLTYTGGAVKVYSMFAPAEAVAPYVIMGPWQSRPDNSKDSFCCIGEINLDVVTRFNENVGSKLPANTIASEITARLKPTTTADVLTVEGFRVWKTAIVDTTELSQNTTTDRIVRKILTVELSLCQQ